jgi:hypothetical protein
MSVRVNWLALGILVAAAASASVFLAAVDAPAWIAILAAGLLGWFLGPSIAERR